MDWRIIEYQIQDASTNMAIDARIAEEVINGKPPTLRFYGWSVSSITLGYFQRINDIGIDLDFCANNVIPVIRRPTGGRAVLHGNELTYSFCSGTNDGIFNDNLLDNYHILSSIFLKAFKNLGLDAVINEKRRGNNNKSSLCFDSPSYGEMTVEGKKIIGSAQRRYKGGAFDRSGRTTFLQQGSIPFIINRELMSKVFGIDNPLNSMAGVNEFLPLITINDLMDAIKKAFIDCFGIQFVETHL